MNPWRDETEEEELARAVQNAAIEEGTDEKKPEEKPQEYVYLSYILSKSYIFPYVNSSHSEL